MSAGGWKAWIAALLAAAFLALLGFGLTRDARELPSALVGREAPAVAGETLSGDSLSLGELRGRVVVLNFWASWCVPCRTEHGVLRRTESSYGDDVRVVGVVYQDGPDAAVGFMERLGGEWPSLRDPGSRIAIDFGVYGVPETFFIAPDGVVARKHVGPVTWDLVRSTVDSLLAGEERRALRPTPGAARGPAGDAPVPGSSDRRAAGDARSPGAS